MLLRNIKPSCGHVNGSKYILDRMTSSVLFLIVISGTHKGATLTLPRMNFSVRTDNFPILGFRRCQFPIRICFAMTINKAQCQYISGFLGIDLSAECFSHGQLYVALSRTTNPRNVFVCTESKSKIVRYVVYPEVFISRFKSKSSMAQLNRIY